MTMRPMIPCAKAGLVAPPTNTRMSPTSASVTPVICGQQAAHTTALSPGLLTAALASSRVTTQAAQGGRGRAAVRGTAPARRGGS